MRTALLTVTRFPLAIAAIIYCAPANAATQDTPPVVISGVPSYKMYNQSNSYEGCVPIAVAETLAYQDLHNGYTGLFPNAQGSALYTEANVDSSIYNIALACQTNISSGSTSPGNIIPGVKSYTASCGYAYQTSSLIRTSITTMWTDLVSEINAGRPMLFYVDQSGTGTADHLVPAIGYSTSASVNYYACWTGGGETSPTWEKFQGKSVGNPYGVYEEIQVLPPALIWTGTVNHTWDTNSTANFSLSGTMNGSGIISNPQASRFSPNHSVTFSDTGINPTIAIASSGVFPTCVTFSNSTEKYILSGGTCGPISGPTSLVLSGGGTVELDNANYYTGGTFVDKGTLIVTSANGLQNGSSLTIGAGGTFIFDTSASGGVIQTYQGAQSITWSPVPEPSTLALLLTGGIALIFLQRKKFWHRS